MLRSGKPHAAVLIYFPFTDFAQEDLLCKPGRNVYQWLLQGHGAKENELPKTKPQSKEQWFSTVWKTINTLNTHGITWDWVNDASLQQASVKQGKVVIRSNYYEAVLIADARIWHRQLPQNCSTCKGRGTCCSKR